MAVNKKKLLQKILSSSKNIRFNDVKTCIELFGFTLDRINGSHHIFSSPKVNELINIQNVKGKAKPYQIKQFLSIVEKHNLQMED